MYKKEQFIANNLIDESNNTDYNNDNIDKINEYNKTVNLKQYGLMQVGENSLKNIFD
jgi:hypothetical protein